MSGPGARTVARLRGVWRNGADPLLDRTSWWVSFESKHRNFQNAEVGVGRRILRLIPRNGNGKRSIYWFQLRCIDAMEEILGVVVDTIREFRVNALVLRLTLIS